MAVALQHPNHDALMQLWRERRQPLGQLHRPRSLAPLRQRHLHNRGQHGGTAGACQPQSLRSSQPHPRQPRKQRRQQGIREPCQLLQPLRPNLHHLEQLKGLAALTRLEPGLHTQTQTQHSRAAQRHLQRAPCQNGPTSQTRQQQSARPHPRSQQQHLQRPAPYHRHLSRMRQPRQWLMRSHMLLRRLACRQKLQRSTVIRVRSRAAGPVAACRPLLLKGLQCPWARLAAGLLIWCPYSIALTAVSLRPCLVPCCRLHNPTHCAS